MGGVTLIESVPKWLELDFALLRAEPQALQDARVASVGFGKRRLVRQTGHPGHGGFEHPDGGLGLCISDQGKPPLCHLGRAERGVEAGETRWQCSTGESGSWSLGVEKGKYLRDVPEMAPRGLVMG